MIGSKTFFFSVILIFCNYISFHLKIPIAASSPLYNFSVFSLKYTWRIYNLNSFQHCFFISLFFQELLNFLLFVHNPHNRFPVFALDYPSQSSTPHDSIMKKNFPVHVRHLIPARLQPFLLFPLSVRSISIHLRWRR